MLWQTLVSVFRVNECDGYLEASVDIAGGRALEVVVW
jgi:hypothetical protein